MSSSENWDAKSPTVSEKSTIREQLNSIGKTELELWGAVHIVNELGMSGANLSSDALRLRNEADLVGQPAQTSDNPYLQFGRAFSCL